MYNEELKEKYIAFAMSNGKKKDESTNDKIGKLIRWTFNKTEDVEQRLDKDIYEMTALELLELMDVFTTSVIASAKSRISAYIIWCISEGLCKFNLMKELSIKSIIEHLEEKDRVFISRRYFAECCNKIKTSENGTYYLALLASAYEGLAGHNYRDLVDLKIADFSQNSYGYYDTVITDFEDNHKRVKRTLSPFAYNALLNASKITELYFQSRTTYLYGEEDLIFKHPNKYDRKKAQKRFSQLFNYIRTELNDTGITVKNLTNSSLFSYIITSAKSDGLDIKAHMTNEWIKEEKLNEKYDVYFRNIVDPKMNFYDFRYRYQLYIKYIDDEIEGE